MDGAVVVVLADPVDRGITIDQRAATAASQIADLGEVMEVIELLERETLAGHSHHWNLAHHGDERARFSNGRAHDAKGVVHAPGLEFLQHSPVRHELELDRNMSTRCDGVCHIGIDSALPNRIGRSQPKRRQVLGNTACSCLGPRDSEHRNASNQQVADAPTLPVPLAGVSFRGLRERSPDTPRTSIYLESLNKLQKRRRKVAWRQHQTRLEHPGRSAR